MTEICPSPDPELCASLSHIQGSHLVGRLWDIWTGNTELPAEMMEGYRQMLRDNAKYKTLQEMPGYIQPQLVQPPPVHDWRNCQYRSKRVLRDDAGKPRLRCCDQPG